MQSWRVWVVPPGTAAPFRRIATMEVVRLTIALTGRCWVIFGEDETLATCDDFESAWALARAMEAQLRREGAGCEIVVEDDEGRTAGRA
jgi:hypothetical protein